MNIEIANTSQIDVNIGKNSEINLTNEVKMYRGPRGYSNYDLAVQNGFEGTLEEYLESLKGEPGTTDYNEQINKPSIEGVELIDNKTFEELGALSLTNMEIEELINNIIL